MILKRNPRLEFWLLMAATFFVHQGLFALAAVEPNSPMADVTVVYQHWLDQASQTGASFGIDTAWIYPFVAWLPIRIASGFFSTDLTRGWVNLAMALNLLALARLVRCGKKPEPAKWRAAWFVLAFIALLGPVAISRLDGISASLALCAIPAFLALKDRAVVVWLTIATWIKVWPFVALGALLAAAPRFKRVFWTAAIASGSLVLVAALNGATQLFSFAAQQGSRGIQIESPLAMPWVWASSDRLSGSRLYYDHTYLTFQVAGPWVDSVARLANLAMFVALGITAWLAFRARKSGAARNELMAAATLTAVLDLIVFNKVGSPQYLTWMLLPVVLALAANLQGYRWVVVGSLALAALTHLIYPLFYAGLVASDAAVVALLTARNLGLIAMLVWANMRLSSLANKA